MPKGKYKNRSHGFHKGNNGHTHSGWNIDMASRQHIQRVPDDEHTFIQENTTLGQIPVVDQSGQMSLQLPVDSSNQRTDYVCLRPKTEKNFYSVYEKEEIDGGKELMIVHKEKTAEFWNMVFREHQVHNNVSATCDGILEWHDPSCEQRGLSWAMAVKCSKCNYISKKVKLYEEVDNGCTGRKAAAQNISIQLGLSRNGVSYTGLIDILASANIPPPSASGLQKTANKVNQVIIEANKDDMHNIREDLKRKKAKIGQANSISCEGDATYNNRCSSSGATPAQPATQATYLLCENDTKEKKIVSALTVNKLCKCKLQGLQGPHLKKCTANIPYTTPIGSEALYLQKCIQDVHSDHISIRDLTVDGDLSARNTATEVIQPDRTSEIEVQYCTRHLGKLLQKKINFTKFTTKIFASSCKTVAQKRECQRLLSMDIAKRAQAEFNQAFNQYGPNLHELVRVCSYLSDTVIKCYSGDCSDCHIHSFVCSRDRPWVRPFLSIMQRFSRKKDIIRPSLADYNKLRTLLGHRFSPQAVRKTYRNKTQNKCEGANRGLSKSNPKHITHSRNYHGRAHAAIHQMNNGPGKSLLSLMKVLNCPMSATSRTVKSLQRMDKRRLYFWRLKRTIQYKDAQARSRTRRYQVWDNNRQQPGYKKCVDIIQQLAVPVEVEHHAYARPRRIRQPVAYRL